MHPGLFSWEHRKKRRKTLNNFDSFGFRPEVASGVTAAGYTHPTPIQAEGIPPVLQGNDVMGLAQTGTGKTAAFVLPILNRLMSGRKGSVRALIIAPTRELAEQIHKAVGELGRRTGLKSLTLYGGVGITPQVDKLRRGADIVVACPGRLLDHINRGTVNLSRLEVLVLDEADQMFDMGFLPDIRRILKHVPAKRQTLLFSATMPREILSLAREVLTDPLKVQVGITAPASTVSHALYPVAQHLKTPLLLELMRNTQTESVLVFTRTKHRAKKLAEQMIRAGHRAASLQGNLSQGRREAAMGGFRDGTFRILVATDIAARGIDVQQISHVINYDIPNTSDAYIHRIGRTGRATRQGDAFTLVTEEDAGMVRTIERILGTPIERRRVEGFDYDAPGKEINFQPPAQGNGASRKTPGPSAPRSFGPRNGPSRGPSRPMARLQTAR